MSSRRFRPSIRHSKARSARRSSACRVTCRRCTVRRFSPRNDATKPCAVSSCTRARSPSPTGTRRSGRSVSSRSSITTVRHSSNGSTKSFRWIWGDIGLSPYRAELIRLTVRVRAIWRHRWVRLTAVALAVPLVLLFFAAGYYYVSFARLLDARLHGERERVFPRVYARPLELRRGQSLTERQLIDRLNDLGYAQRAAVEKPGEFAIGQGAVALIPRAPSAKGQVVRVVFQRQTPANAKRPPPKPPARAPDRVLQLELGTKPSERLTLDAPLLTAIINGEREKRRPVALSAIPDRMVQAVLAIEDRRYYEHPGVDPIGMLGAVFSYLTGRRTYLAGGSTITQQLVRNVFLPKLRGVTLQQARARTLQRKLVEIWVSLVLTSRASKTEILELYLNDIPLGQRGSFAIAGVSEAARLFFGKDISNITLAEAATIAGVIQAPGALSPFTNPVRCKERRNVVLDAMVEAGYVTRDIAERASKEPLVVVQRALEAEAPYFVDYVGQTLDDQYPGLTTRTDQAVEVYTTLDQHLQRLAQ